MIIVIEKVREALGVGLLLHLRVDLGVVVVGKTIVALGIGSLLHWHRSGWRTGWHWHRSGWRTGWGRARLWIGGFRWG